MEQLKNKQHAANLQIANDKEYQIWLIELKSRYRKAQIKAATHVNEELIRFYWNLGADIFKRNDENRYGSNFYSSLSNDLQRLIPNTMGFSETNLKLCKRFYMLYSNIQNRQQLVVDSDSSDSDEVDTNIFRIGWGHHQCIISKVNGNREKALFYVYKTLENNWSRAMLLNMIGDKDGNGGLYESQGKAITNFKSTLPSPDTELAHDILKDPYNLHFLHLYENYQEQDLQLALEQNIVEFLLELGNGFAFVGRQKSFIVNGDEFKADLLFYHLKLHRYVVVELKVVKFQPEFVSKLNFYCACVNHQLKSSEDGDTIGLLICKEKNEVVARWTLENNQQQPLGISTYRISDILPSDQQITDRIHQLEQELNRLRKLQQTGKNS